MSKPKHSKPKSQSQSQAVACEERRKEKKNTQEARSTKVVAEPAPVNAREKRREEKRRGKEREKSNKARLVNERTRRAGPTT